MTTCPSSRVYVAVMSVPHLVSTGAGGKAREVLVKKDYFDEVDAQLR